MESFPITEPHLMPILEELKQREPIFHRPEFGTSRADFDAMMANDFREVGASGRRYSRAFILDELERRYSKPFDDEWETKEFCCQEIAPDHYLLTYTLFQGERITRRATIWRRTSDGWKIVYHQGTIVEQG